MSAKRFPAVMAVTAAVALGALALAGPAQASADTHQKNVRTGTAYRGAVTGKVPAVSPAAALAVTMPKGYVVVNSGSLSAPAGTQTHGSVTCPTGKVPLGGGIFFSSGSVTANINSSYPTATGWGGDVNNASAGASFFTVYVTCSKKPGTAYHLVAGNVVTVNPGAQVSATATCATGKPISGGIFSNTTSTAANLNTSIPITNGWRVDANNGSAAAEQVTPYVMCANVTKYKIVTGTATTNGSGTQTSATASCTGTVPVGGGAFSSSGSTAVNLNTTFPTSTGWESFENNNSTGTATITPYVVCA